MTDYKLEHSLSNILISIPTKLYYCSIYIYNIVQSNPYLIRIITKGKNYAIPGSIELIYELIKDLQRFLLKHF